MRHQVGISCLTVLFIQLNSLFVLVLQEHIKLLTSSVSIPFLPLSFYIKLPQYWDILSIDAKMCHMSGWSTHESPIMNHFCVAHITNSSPVNGLQMAPESNRLSSALCFQETSFYLVSKARA